MRLQITHTPTTKSAIRFILASLLLLAATTSVQARTEAQGSWTKKSFSVAGTWKIEEQGGKAYVVLSDDFKTRSAPDLKIFLSPTEAKSANGKNATKGSVLVGELPKSKGAVRLEVPAGVDVTTFKSILLHCEQYSKLWAAAPLNQ